MTKIVVFIACICCLMACKEQKKEPVPIDWSANRSATFNKDLVQEEELAIRMYLDQRPTWKVTETGTGLRFYAYQTGTGEMAVPGKMAIVRFKIHLLDGTLCYETEGTETESFKIDKSEIESGVQEGVKLMRVGDKAKLIIPNHLGHGLAGDFDKIPPLSTIVVDLELVGVK